MSDEVKYSTDALVVVFPDHLGRGEVPNWKGTLDEAVSRVMAMTAEQQSRAYIIPAIDAVPGMALLRIKEIAELHQRPDFPKA